MADKNTYESFTGTTCFDHTIENTSCTGGTITEIYTPTSEEESSSTSYVITFKELRSCDGFENVSVEQAEEIITTLYQLSAICYRNILE